ncbi:MAG: hypothetical protein JWM80_5303 [Cyanobacteria bacterium RYN_339]|nr:hypothetical protein [Cyanobacteria bacterium RYN_339]
MRILQKHATAAISPADAWQAWTTAEGIKRFFSPEARIELRIGGAYEPLFMLDQPPGGQGAEGCKVLSFLPERMISFSWNAPHEFPHLRTNYQCWVVVELTATASGGTHVTLSHLGWGEGEDWDGLYAYFDRAWGFVMQSFEDTFTAATA